MTARYTSVPRQFIPTHKSKFKTLIVNGCSYSSNNSLTAPVSWPYYLRDLCNFQQVFDYSQGASGSNHIFTSTIYELETNKTIDYNDTLVIIMWSGLSRVDLVAKKNIDSFVDAQDKSLDFWMRNRYYYFDDLISLPLVRPRVYNGTLFNRLQESYHKLIDIDAQIFSSATKILALSDYLKNKKIPFMFLTWEKTSFDLEICKLPMELDQSVREKIHDIKSLGQHADEMHMRIPNDGHPSPNAHLTWTKEHLIPGLEDLGYASLHCQNN